MRVIAGNSRGRKLTSPKGETPRPTTDRVKESMFNILQMYLPQAEVVDVFAGTGQLGIEALSRGAASCLFIDNNKQAHELQKENLMNTHLMEKASVVLGNYVSILQHTSKMFHVALVDPPYDANLVLPALEVLAARMHENAVVLCETKRKELLPDTVLTLKKQKEYLYGQIKLTLYEKTAEKKEIQV